MKKILLIAMMVASAVSASAQIINQDATGTSTIVAQGTSVSLNITEAQIQATHSGLFQPKNLANATWFYGVDIKAKNQTGIATLFDNGKFSPDGSLSFTIGKRFIHFFYEAAPNTPADAALSTEVIKVKHRLDPAYSAEAKRLTGATTLPQGVKNTVSDELQALALKGLVFLDESLAAYKTTITDSAQIVVIKQITADLSKWVLKQPDFQQLHELQFQIDQTPTNVKKHIPNSATYWYLRGGFSASQFSYDLGGTFTDYAKRFMDTTAVNYQIAAGYTYQFKRHFLGINIGYARQSNQALLTSADYTYNYQDTTLKSGKLTKQKAFTAYSGAYGFYSKAFLNIDYQYLFDLDPGTKKYFALGPYLRWNQLFNAGDLAKNNAVLGVSANYIDGKAGKFLGGIYLQSSDITGQTQPKFKKTIQFGLVAKFSLSTIFITD